MDASVGNAHRLFLPEILNVFALPGEKMNRTLRFPVILSALFLGMLLCYLWGTQQMPVTDPVESNYALTAKEMVLSGDWLSPQIYGQYWYDKPALVYWLLSASYTVFGFSNFASRLPAALCGALTVTLFAWYAGRLLKDRAAGLWAAVFLGTSVEVWVISHAVITDSLLLLFTVPTLCAAYLGVTEKSWKHMTIAWAAAGFACLAKGPVGLVLPGILLFLWCLSRKSAGDVLRLFFPGGILAFLLIAAPWYCAMYSLHGQEFIDQLIGLHNVTRALASEHPEDNYFFYYLLVLPASLLPWTGLSFYTMAKRWKSRDSLYDFLMIWCWGTVLFYTLVATKYITYTYIAVAPGVLLAALALEDFRKESCRAAQLSLIGPYILTLIALIAGTVYLPGNFLSFYVIAGYSGFLLYAQWKKKQFGSMLILSTASMAVGLCCLVFGGLTNFIASRSSLDMADAFHSLPGQHYFFKSYPPSYTYYTDETAVRVYDEGMDSRDPRWNDKYAVPTVTTDALLAAGEKGPVYLYVDKSDADQFAAWAGQSRFREVQAFPNGAAYEMERP